MSPIISFTWESISAPLYAILLRHFLRINYSWGYAFAAAGFGMVLSMIFFAPGQKYVKHADVIKPVQKEDMPFSKIVSYVFLPAIAAGIIGWFYSG